MANIPIATLDAAKAWLGRLGQGQSVAVSPGLFQSAMIAKLYTMLPGCETIQLADIAVDAAAASLAGTADLLGSPGCGVRLDFSQPEGAPLLLTLGVTLPQDTTWSLIPGFQWEFAGLSATFAPLPEVTAISLTFACRLQFQSLHIPVALSVPAVAGADWTLTSREAGVVLTSEALTALAGGNDPKQLLPDTFPGEFTFTNFAMAFDGQTGTCSLLQVDLAYGADWSFFDGHFTVDSLAFEFTAYRPFTDKCPFQAVVAAKMSIGGTSIDVGLQYPDNCVFAYLDDETPLGLSDVFAFFRIPLPTDFPDIAISVLSFLFHVSDCCFQFQIGIDTPFAIAGDVKLDSFSFDLDVTYADSKFTGQGDLGACFRLGSGDTATRIRLQGGYGSDAGLALNGKTANLAIGQVIEAIAADFGVAADRIPQPIRDLALDMLEVSQSTGATGKAFAFTCTGHTVIAETKVEFIPDIRLTFDAGAKNWTTRFAGTINLDVGDEKISFAVTFSSDAKERALAASSRDSGGQGLTFERIAAAFGFSLPEIPPELDLELVAADFRYDFVSGTLAFGMTSAGYGQAKCAFVSKKFDGTRKHVFLLAASPGLCLSDLPLLGAELAKIETVSLDDLIVAITSVPTVSENEATAFNAILTALGNAYPQVPKTGLAGNVVLTAGFAIGDEAPIPLSLSLGGGSAKAGPALDTMTPAPAVVGTGGATGGDGIVWFNVQKTLGPVSMQKVGLRYAKGKLRVLLDASMGAGGLTITLLDLGFGSPLGSFRPEFSLSGLLVNLVEGPVSVSGGLVGQCSPEINFYGELSLATSKLSLGALGGYAERNGHPSFFLYASLGYPLGGPPFFFITGLAAGIGCNRSLLIPGIEGVADFPLVAWARGKGAPSADPGQDIAKQVATALAELSQKGVSAPAVGRYWLAAGVNFTSFGLVASFALLTARIGGDFEVNLLGLSELAVPRASPVVRLELALLASFVPSAGYLGIIGQLTSKSYVLSPDAKLSGGFAFSLWFAGEHAGQFVITAGGYSPRFAAPGHYPTVPRLGLAWKVCDALSITGAEYFALTSGAVMAGGSFNAVWHCGPVKAWFLLQADFLMTYTPFHYALSGSVQLGASVRINLLFTSFTSSIHLGVGIEIWGPPFSGLVHVDLCIVSFTISFGAKRSPGPNTVSWADFVNQLLPGQSPARGALAARDATGQAQPVGLAAATGLVSQRSETEGDLNWLVDPEMFTLRIDSVIPLKKYVFPEKTVTVPSPVAYTTDFGVGPAGIAAADFTSTLTVTVTTESHSVFTAGMTLGNVPKSFWEKREFDNHGVPVGVDPVGDTTIIGALTGFTLVPTPPAPGQTLPIDDSALRYTTDPQPRHLGWSAATVQTADPFTNQTVAATIAAAPATQNRPSLLAAIARQGLAVSQTPEVLLLAETASYLHPQPQLRYLGEAR